MEEKSCNYWAILGIFALFLLIQVLSIVLAEPFLEEGFQAFEDPEAISNSFLYLAYILIFTVFILIILKFKAKWVLYVVILGIILFTIYFALDMVFSNPFITIGITALIGLLLYKFSEWYVIDAVGVAVGASATALFGISLGVIPVIVLMVVLAVYDFISVYKTKHMLTLAEGVLDMKLPIFLVVPKVASFSIMSKDLETDDAYFVGLGDVIIPTTLVVSANAFMESRVLYGFINFPALGALIGTLVGLGILLFFVVKGEPHAGLPLLNSFAIIGLIIFWLL